MKSRGEEKLEKRPNYHDSDYWISMYCLFCGYVYAI